MADLRLRARPLSHLQGKGKHAAEHPADRARGRRHLKRVADLAQNLGLAEYHRIDPARDQQEVPHRFVADANVVVAFEVGLGDLP